MAKQRIQLVNDYARGGWLLDYAGPETLPFMTFYTGPFASRGDAQRAIPEYLKRIEEALGDDLEPGADVF